MERLKRLRSFNVFLEILWNGRVLELNALIIENFEKYLQIYDDYGDFSDEEEHVLKMCKFGEPAISEFIVANFSAEEIVDFRSQLHDNLEEYEEKNKPSLIKKLVGKIKGIGARRDDDSDSEEDSEESSDED